MPPCAVEMGGTAAGGEVFDVEVFVVVVVVLVELVVFSVVACGLQATTRSAVAQSKDKVIKYRIVRDSLSLLIFEHDKGNATKRANVRSRRLKV